jgi:hypothetical protein
MKPSPKDQNHQTIPGTYTFQSFTNSPNCVNAFKQKASYPPMKPSPKTKSTNPLI